MFLSDSFIYHLFFLLFEIMDKVTANVTITQLLQQDSMRLPLQFTG